MAKGREDGLADFVTVVAEVRSARRLVKFAEAIDVAYSDTHFDLINVITAGRAKYDRIAVGVVQRFRLREKIRCYDQAFVTRCVAPRQRVSGLIQLDKRSVRDVAMLLEAVAHRQLRVECQLQ